MEYRSAGLRGFETTAVMPARYPLSPHHRIKKKRDFARLQASAGKIYAPHFLLIVGPSPSGTSRLGLTVTRKVDPLAVGRNRIKRRLREVFRHLRLRLIAPLDIIVIARNGSTMLASGAIEREITTALRAHKLIGAAEL
jgi:ribonuclease P protein component